MAQPDKTADKQTLPPESGERPSSTVAQSTRSATTDTLRQIGIPPELTRAEMAHRLDTAQLRIEGLTLRPNQLKAISALREFLLGTNEDLGYFIQPTGAGKTFTFGLIARLLDTQTLILVPTRQLVRQTVQELTQGLGFTEDQIGLIEPGKPVPQDKKVLVSTYGSHVSRLKEAEGTFDKDYKKAVVGSPLVICDEAHRALGERTTEAMGLTRDEEREQEWVLENLETSTSAQSLKLGFTATPDLSRKSVGRWFRNLIAEESFENLRQAGILVPHRSHVITTRCETQEVTEQTTANEEGEILRKHDMYRRMLNRWKEIRQTERGLTGRPNPLRTMVFCANTEECQKWVEEAEKMDIRCRIVTYREGDEAVPEATGELLRGEVDMIVTVNKLAEGFDCRPINCVILARATSSPVKIAQPAGRGLRVQKEKENEEYGEKRYCHIIEGKFLVAPRNETDEPGSEELPADQEENTDREEAETDREFLKKGASTMTFDEYLQTREGVSGEFDQQEARRIRTLEFDEHGTAIIQMNGEYIRLVIPEVYLQNFPFIDPVKLSADKTLQPVKLNENLCRFGNIQVSVAYKKEAIDSLIMEVYSRELHLSEEGTGILADKNLTLSERTLAGTEVVSVGYIRRRLAGFAEEEMSEAQIIKLLSARGVQKVILPPDLRIVSDERPLPLNVFLKSEIDALEEKLTAPATAEEKAKASFSVPEDEKSDVMMTIHFEEIDDIPENEGVRNLRLLNFGLVNEIKAMVENIRRAKDMVGDTATLKFLREKLNDYVDHLDTYGMKNEKKGRIAKQIVEQLAIDPIEDLILDISEELERRRGQKVAELRLPGYASRAEIMEMLSRVDQMIEEIKADRVILKLLRDTLENYVIVLEENGMQKPGERPKTEEFVQKTVIEPTEQRLEKIDKILKAAS